MQPTENTLFTPNEAAVLTQLPLKAVHNAIDKKTVPTVAGSKAGSTRLLDLHALMSLTLERRLAARFGLELRREVFSAMADTPRDTVSIDGGFLTIDLREPRKELAGSIRALRRVRELVTVDPAIMGGDPVFRGTRVPVHMIAALVDRRSPEVELLEDYPRLTAEMVRLAPLYAAAYPLRGRPRAYPWRGKPPTRTSRRKLSDFEAG